MPLLSVRQHTSVALQAGSITNRWKDVAPRIRLLKQPFLGYFLVGGTQLPAMPSFV